MKPDENEFNEKISRVRGLLGAHGVDAILLRRVSSFAWATCGAASYVSVAASEGGASLMITPDQLLLFTNNIEAPRLEKEEQLGAQGWEFHVAPWETPTVLLEKATAGLRVAADVAYGDCRNIGAEMAQMRTRLTPEEGLRFRELGGLCAEAMTAAVLAARPGMDEHTLAALLDLETRRQGVTPIVNLVAVDGRVALFRHPLPTARKMEKYAMLVLCGRQRGLVCSITRLVHFGAIPEDLRGRIAATAQVNARLIASTRPGMILGEVFAQGQEAYADAGFAGEWKHHHQGGAIGYEPREILVTPGSTEKVTLGQAFAWNPSIAGAKCEDTILVGKDTNEIITSTSLWPMISTHVPGTPKEILSAAALER